MTPQVESGSTRSERLDRLPFTREHTRLVVGSGLGWALDAMDVGLISFVMAALAVQWRLGTTTLSAIASIGFVGMAIGASLGGLLAALIGYFVVSASDDGWRWALGVGVVPAVYAVFIRFGLPESVRFLEQRGREAEAETAVRRFEGAAGIAPPQTPTPTRAETAPASGPGDLWRPGQRLRTASLWLVWFGVNFSYYGAFIWLPTFLVASDLDLASSFGFTLVITLAQLPGYASAAVLVEAWGRRPTLSLFLVGSAGSAVAFGLADMRSWQSRPLAWSVRSS